MLTSYHTSVATAFALCFAHHGFNSLFWIGHSISAPYLLKIILFVSSQFQLRTSDVECLLLPEQTVNGISTEGKFGGFILVLGLRFWNHTFKCQMLQTSMIKDRGFARAVAPQLQRQVSIKIFRESAGTVIDPYKPYTRLPFLKRWFTKEGWKQRKQRFLHEIMTAYAVAKLKQKAGYTRQKFYLEVTGLYHKINSAIAEGDRTALRQLVTENMFSILKKEFKQREGVWERISWKIVGPVKIQTLQGRLAQVNPKTVDNAFVQVTLMIQSSQKFAAFDKQGKVVAGDPDKQILVEDTWVFETILGHPDKAWRLCARISA